MGWAVAFVLLVLLSAAVFLLIRATRRLIEFDSIFGIILQPMQEYADELRKISTAEGLLHDHPEVIAFHRANMKMLHSIDAAIRDVKETQPQPKPKGLPPQAA